MRALVLLGVVLAASAFAHEEAQTRYHEAVGIPTAKKIRIYEQKILKEHKFERIVGGVLAPTNAHPYLAGVLISLVGSYDKSVCGSSLLSANRLVTAAHCWCDGHKQASQFNVRLGSNFLFSGGIAIATSQVIVHPQWNYYNLANDIAMIYLPTQVRFTASIQPISLPAAFEQSTFVGNWAVAAGFGKTSDRQKGSATVLSHVKLQVISNQYCQAVFGNVRSSNLCTSGAGGVGICGGDSGGPLALNLSGRTTLIGISSFVSKDNCQGGLPSAFTRVTSFRSFINQHLGPRYNL